MTVFPQDERLKDRAAMAAMRVGLKLSPARQMSPEARPAYDEVMAKIPVPSGVETSAERVGGVPGWWCRPAGAPADRAILYLHGGGYVVGSAAAYRGLAGQLAQRAGAALFVADYALAPERPFPAAFDDGWSALQGLVQETGGQVALAGDSAGGGLALALLLATRRTSARPRAAAVLSPWIDPTLSSGSIKSRAASDPIILRRTLDAAVKLHLGDADPRDPRANALSGDFGEMPAVRIDVGNDEILLGDALRFHEAAAATGGSCDVHVWEGMTHVFPASFASLEAGAAALDEAASFLRSTLRIVPPVRRCV